MADPYLVILYVFMCEIFILFLNLTTCNSMSGIEALQLEVTQWYHEYKESTRMKIKHLVDANMLSNPTSNANSMW